MSVLGKLIYQLYYQPKGKRAIIKKFGGSRNYSQMLKAEQAMKVYALNDLKIDADLSPQGKFKINFLTGDRFIHQTLFCTYSFFKYLEQYEAADFSVNYYDDGTLGAGLTAALKKRAPQVRVITSGETERIIAEHLPQSKYPYLNKNVRMFPLFKKLIYPNLGNEGLLTFFDSDMLFLDRPVEFLDWLFAVGTNTDKAFCIQDVQRSYGYTDAEILRLWPKAIHHDINSGMYTLHSKNMDWEFIEELAKQLEQHYGPHYYMEQLITAILLERSGDLMAAPKSKYIVFPSYEQIQHQTGTLHHYVNESKEYYFKEGWKRQIRSLSF